MRPLALAVFVLVAGCSQTHTIHVPPTTAVRYEGQPSATAIQLVDQRPADPPFSHGRATIHVKFDGATDELDFFGRHLVRELGARGVRAALGTTGASVLRGTVRTFYVRNRQTSGFAPMVTFNTFAADFTDGRKTARIAAYSKHGKVAVWSSSELEEPLFNLPMRILIGEVAAKINREFLGLSSSDANVAAIAARARGGDPADALNAIYELGFTNNPAAVAPLVQLTSHEAETFRAAALSGLGILGAAAQMPLLVRIHQSGSSHSDRYAALKAIGDLGTPDALQFVRAAADHAQEDDREHLREIARLYLEGRPAGVASPAPAPVAPTAGT